MEFKFSFQIVCFSLESSIIRASNIIQVFVDQFLQGLSIQN